MNEYEFWFMVAMGVFSLVIVKMIFTMVTSIVRAVHENRQHWGKHPNSVPPMFEKMVDKTMQERDELMDEMLARIEVLERILTDQHNQTKAKQIADEIDKL